MLALSRSRAQAAASRLCLLPHRAPPGLRGLGTGAGTGPRAPPALVRLPCRGGCRGRGPLFVPCRGLAPPSAAVGACDALMLAVVPMLSIISISFAGAWGWPSLSAAVADIHVHPYPPGRLSAFLPSFSPPHGPPFERPHVATASTQHMFLHVFPIVYCYLSLRSCSSNSSLCMLVPVLVNHAYPGYPLSCNFSLNFIFSTLSIFELISFVTW